MTDETNLEKPKKVVLAIRLLIVGMCLGLLNFIVEEAITKVKDSTRGTVLFFGFFGVILEIVLIYQMYLGKKWARTTYSILFVLGILLFPFSLGELFKSNLFVAILSVARVILDSVALVMLFTEESTDWFYEKKNI
ncbi:MAG: hypothetical protein HY089_01155 [Ignavibacteriales bacterium]|nr:hypothetical protein [Ignavibacteriales bacterium]